MVPIFLAEGFEEIEAITVIDILRRADILVEVIGIGGKIIKGSHDISVVCDIDEKELKYSDSVEMVVLPGGMPGTLNLRKSNVVMDYIKLAIKDNIYIAAICAAPIILGNMGALDGRIATCYEGFESQLIGANISNISVCHDNNFITARGPGVAIQFALKLVEIILGKDICDKIKASLLI